MSDEMIALYPFRYFDLVQRRWYRARYKARLDIIAERYAAFQVVGSPEIRKGLVGAFSPFR